MWHMKELTGPIENIAPSDLKDKSKTKSANSREFLPSNFTAY